MIMIIIITLSLS